MPTFENVTTKSANEVWKTPDGKMTISEIVLDIAGKDVKAKTYSNAIATVGWSGTVESYEKTGRNGVETFVKQPQKEGFSGGGRSFAKPQGDQFTMYLSYAKDVAVAMLENGKLDEVKFGEVLDSIADGGKTLYEARPGAEPTVEIPRALQAKEKDTDVLEETPSLEELNEIFPDVK